MKKDELMDAMGIPVSMMPQRLVESTDVVGSLTREAAAELGLQVPEDLSIAGYDESRIAALTRPRLTTVAQDAERMGRQAAKYLIDRIENPRTAVSETGMIPTRLIKGESVGPVKAV